MWMLFLVWELRTLVILWVSDPATMDSVCEYIPMAYNLVHFHMLSKSPHLPLMPTSVRTPAYPLFLSLFYIPWMDYPNIVFCIQAALEGMTAWLLYKTAKFATHGNVIVARVAALLFLLYPFNLIAPSTLGREALYLPVLVGCFYLYLRAVDQPRWTRFLAVGAAFGFAVCVREDALLHFLVLIVVGWFLGRRSWKARLQHAAIMLAAFGLMLAPWIIRNALAFHRFIPTSSISFCPLWVWGNLEIDSANQPHAPIGIVDKVRERRLLKLLPGTDLTQLREARYSIEYNRYLDGPSEQSGWPYDYYCGLMRSHLQTNAKIYPLIVLHRLSYYLLSSRIGELPAAIQKSLPVESKIFRGLCVMWNAVLVILGLAGLLMNRRLRCLAFSVLWPYVAIAVLGWPAHHYAFPSFVLLFVGVALLKEPLLT